MKRLTILFALVLVAGLLFLPLTATRRTTATVESRSMSHLSYLKYVLRHKWFVFVWCMRIGGIGLFRAILHDWDKFLPDEWFPYVRTFYKSDGSKQYVESTEFARAWRLHQIRNKHHWQYWLLTWDRGVTEPLPMPTTHAAEMVADWQGAGQAITGKADSKSWYEKNKDKMILHPDTRSFVEYLLHEVCP